MEIQPGVGDEFARIVPIANRHGVDPYFILAIRHAENGGPGKEFGVLSVHATTWEEQCAVCCVTVAHRLADFSNRPNPLSAMEYVRGSLVYREEFIRHFASIWAPRGASNDPHNLNANWASNVIKLYGELRGHAV